MKFIFIHGFHVAFHVCHGQGCRYIWDGKNPTFNDGNPYNGAL